MKRPIRSILLSASLFLMAAVGACSGPAGNPDVAVPDDGEPDAGIDVVIIVDEGGHVDTNDTAGDEGVGEDIWFEDEWETEGVIEPGYFGAPCQNNRECFVGFCVQAAEGSVCTKNCYEEGDCPESWKCRAVSSVGDPVYICVPSGVWLCRPCETNEHCASTLELSADRCVVQGAGGNYCGMSCGQDGDSDCPSGYSCQEVPVVGGETSMQCVPDLQECQCSEAAVKAGASTSCFVSNSFGVCRGIRQCLEGGLTQCDARNPGEETCNGVDDDCDGVTDNEGASGCKNYYVDNDQDGWGIGVAHCLCGEPGQGYSTKPGDCNDSSQGMNPAVREVCNGMDDDCNGITDEPGSFGCTDYSLDNDGDGSGQPGAEKRCLCQKTPPFTGVIVGDCDDARADVCPDPVKCKEKCDSIDNDCDGQTDVENSVGCSPYYFDSDQDTYGLPSKYKCLCAAQGLYTATRAGDCVDTDPNINSTGDEVCNGVDDNCNGKTDEGDVSALCPAPPGVVMHGSTTCAGTCKIGSCDPATVDGLGNYVPAWFDVNGSIMDGCECQADGGEQMGGQTCNSAVSLGAVPDNGFRVSSDSSKGSIVPTEDVDWYVFQASDVTWSGETGNCDYYNVRVRFTRNPSNQFMFDVYRGSCAAGDQICAGGGDHEWAVNFLTGTGSSMKGECPCSNVKNLNCDTPPSYQECLRVESDPQKCNSCPGYGSTGRNLCSDNTAKVYLKVYRDPLKPATCEGYELEISNGLYPYSGS